MTRWILLSAATCAILVGFPRGQLQAQDPDSTITTVPNGDTDLVAATAAATTIQRKAAAIRSQVDAQYGADQAQAVLDALATTLALVETLEPWTERARRDLHDRHTGMIRNTVEQGQRLGDAQLILAYQSLLIDIANYATDIASLTDFLRKLDKGDLEGPFVQELIAILRNPTASTTTLNRMLQIDRIASYISAGSTVAANAEKLMRADGQSGPAWGSTVENARKLVAYTSNVQGMLLKLVEARATGERVAKLLKFKGMAGPLVELGKQFATQSQQQMKDRIGELERSIAAEQRATTDAHGHYRRIGQRYDRLVAARSRLQAAFTQLQVALGEARPSARLAAPPQPLPGWGDAFRYYHPKLQAAANDLRSKANALRVTDGVSPRIWLDRNTFRPGEQIVVHYELPASIARGGWIGMFPGDAPHSTEAANVRTKLDLRDVPNAAEGQNATGTVTFTAPETAGSYSVRLNHSRSNREVRSVSFAVRTSARARLVFGESMNASGDTATLPAVREGEHREFPIDMKAVSVEDDSAVGGLSVQVTVSGDSDDGVEPRINNRFQLQSQADGSIRNGAARPVIWNIPPGTWRITFSAEGAANSLTVIANGPQREDDDEGPDATGDGDGDSDGDSDGEPGATRTARPTLSGNVSPEVVDVTAESAEQRKAVVYGFASIGPADVARYRIEARVPGAESMQVPGAGAGNADAPPDAWTALDTGSTASFYVIAVMRQGDTAAERHAEFRIIDVESGQSVATGRVPIRLQNIGQEVGVVHFTVLDGAGADDKGYTIKVFQGDKQIGVSGGRGTMKLPAGSYEASVQCLAYQPVRKPFTVTGGREQDVRVDPGFGRARFVMINGVGNEIGASLHVFRGDQQIGSSLGGAVRDLPPGSYVARWTGRGIPEQQQSHSFTVVHGAQQDVRLDGRFGRVRIRTLDKDGNETGAGVELVSAGKHLRRVYGKRTVDLLPGSYELTTTDSNGDPVSTSFAVSTGQEVTATLRIP